MEGVRGTIYEGERFQLQFIFSKKYPFESPQVNQTISKDTFDRVLILSRYNLSKMPAKT